MIIVLEDMQVRVDWLRDAFGALHAVNWRDDVESFLLALDGVAPTLVILDHDLGGPIDVTKPEPRMSRDADGLTGLDACDRMPVVACPVLVWSMNPVRAPIMVQTLQRRGMRALWAPYGTPQCAAAIVRAVTA